MERSDLFRIFGINDTTELPVAVMTLLMGDIDRRDAVYKDLLIAADYDMGYDWFQAVYEQEMAERKQKKQDFTPPELGMLCSELTGKNTGSLHEPTAGNGSMVIADWWCKCKRVLPWDCRPSENMVTCWELSDRALPLLLLNLSIRGIMGYVYHGDVLEGTVKQKFILLNRHDDALAFSEVVKASTNDIIRRE